MPEPESFHKCACQSCGGHIEFPASAAGAKVACPHCHFDTVLQAPPVIAPPAPKSSARSQPLLIPVTVVLLAIATTAAWYLNRQPQVLAPNLPAQTNAPPAAIVARSAQPKPAPPPPPDLWHGLMPGTVTLEKAENGNLVYAVGVLRNESTRQRYGVKVQLELFDDNGAKVGTTTDYTQFILPGKEWRFRALVVEHRTARAELTKVTEQE